MPKFKLSVKNAARQPLPDRMDVHLERGGSLVAKKFDVDGSTSIEFTIDNGAPYALRVFPNRHRAVSRFVVAGEPEITLFTPIHPSRIVQVIFPEHADLPAELKSVLRDAAIEGLSQTGKKLYDSLEPEPKAGLLNLFTKMTNTRLPAAGSALEFIDRLYRLRPDRIFFDAKDGYRDALKAAVSAGSFKAADDSLHTPPQDFTRAGSFKSDESHGNLQLSFFSGSGQPPVFKVDADIDESGGIGHAFEVIRNLVTSGETNPYDVHQIMTYHFTPPLYEILTRN